MKNMKKKVLLGFLTKILLNDSGPGSAMSHINNQCLCDVIGKLQPKS